jgi:hypothetical protein
MMQEEQPLQVNLRDARLTSLALLIGMHMTTSCVWTTTLSYCFSNNEFCSLMKVARCTKIISPNTDDAKYVINVKQIAKVLHYCTIS